MAFPKRASAESAIHAGNQFISNQKSICRIESRLQGCSRFHIWFLGRCPRLTYETAPFGAKQIPSLWPALVGNRAHGVIFLGIYRVNAVAAPCSPQRIRPLADGARSARRTVPWLQRIRICERESTDYEKEASPSRSRHRDSLRLRRCDWADSIHDGSREERSSCHSGNSQCAIARTGRCAAPGFNKQRRPPRHSCANRQ